MMLQTSNAFGRESSPENWTNLFNAPVKFSKDPRNEDLK
jgi:hypothetical protein